MPPLTSPVTAAPYEVGASWLTNGVTPYLQGLPPEPRPELLGYNSPILCLVMAMLLVVIFNIRHYPRFFGATMRDLFSLRDRNHLFDAHTVDETRAVVACVLQLCVCEALLGVAALRMVTTVDPARIMAVVGVIAAAALVYYLWQVAIYNFIGYVFYDKSSTALWMRGFYSSQTLLGMALLIPALAVLYYPSMSAVLLFTSILLYFTARFLFIYKGFRIFYKNFDSLLYFILYLCSVEIIPLILLFNGTFSLCCNIIS